MINDRVSNLQKSTADTNSRFSDLETETRELHGKIEVLENRMGQNAMAQEKTKKAAEDQSAELAKKVQILQDELAKLQEQLTQVAGEVASRPAETSAVNSGKNDRSHFELAEDLFEKKDYRKAILNFQKFRETRPRDKKVPEAIYKIGVSFQELGMKDEARTFYEELLAKYSNSQEAKRAKIRLKKLK